MIQSLFLLLLLTVSGMSMLALLLLKQIKENRILREKKPEEIKPKKVLTQIDWVDCHGKIHSEIVPKGGKVEHGFAKNTVISDASNHIITVIGSHEKINFIYEEN